MLLLSYLVLILTILPSIYGQFLGRVLKFSAKYTVCQFGECCQEEYIKNNVPDFSKVFGQHLAVRELKDAIAGFYKQKERSKPLVLSFHGTPGTGKNFIADQMVTARYKEGKSSKYVHGYSGRINFPVEADAEKYSTELQSDIFRSIRDCPHQTFIFDEVDKMPAGVFENIVDLLDHNTFLRVDMSRTIFIFISNLGGVEIANELSLLMFNGIQREKSELFHFEPILEKCAYNYEGGLKKSRSIEKAVIDYYVPFLPLEQRHVELCIRQLIANSSQSPSLNLIQKVLKSISYEGEFAVSGCKKLEARVNAGLHSEL